MTQLGRVGAFSAALALAIGPSYLYFSRFAREDIYIAAITLALLVVAFRFLNEPRRYHPALIGALLALSFATKETTFITRVRGRDVLPRRARLAAARPRASRRSARSGWTPGAGALAALRRRLHDPVHDVPHQPRGRARALHGARLLARPARGGPRRRVADLLRRDPGFIEWPALLLGAIGAVVAIRRPTLLRVFLVWAFVVSLVVYSWAGEKFAWLVLHPLLPLLLLAGVGVQAIWDARRHWYGGSASRPRSACFAYVVFASYSVNARYRADPRELLVSTQSSEDVAKVADQVMARAKAADAAGRPFSVTIDSAEGATFPWAWYFRDLRTGYIDLGGASDAPPPDTDVLILTQGARDRLDPRAARHVQLARVPVPCLVGARVRQAAPGSAWRYLTKREPWNRPAACRSSSTSGAEAARPWCHHGRTRGRRARPTSRGPCPRTSCARWGRTRRR